MVKIKRQLVLDTPYKYGRSNNRLYITVHETDNWNKGANAQMHANLQSNGNSRSAAWHWQVDDIQAIQSFTHDFQLWQSGDGRGNGNLNSISIEICVNNDIDYKKAYQNAAELVKMIMEEEDVSLSNVVQHNRWSGKNCPRFLRSGEKEVSWVDFNRMINGSSGTVSAPDTQTKPSTIAKPKKKTGNARIRTIQSTLNSRYNTSLKVDGYGGPLTKKGVIKGYQIELNKQFNAGLNVDGIWGSKTTNASVTVRKGARGNITWLIQARLYCLGYNPKGLDGIFGNGLAAAVRSFQSKSGIGADGIPGKITFASLFG